MAIPFHCPHCRTYTEVDDQFAGQSGPCVVCGKLVTAPSRVEADQGQLAQPTARSSSRRLWIRFLLFAGVVFGCMVVGIGIVAFFLATLVPAIQTARDKGNRQECWLNMERIGMALQAYSDANGAYPPAYIADENGKPMHSWRVLILPYLGHGRTYEKYNFDEPWDSPGNLRVTKSMPDVFACPHNPATRKNSETNYMVVMGSKTMFPGDQSVSFVDITDGLADTIMVVETTAAGVTWTKPEDLDFNKMSFSANTGSTADMGSPHAPNGAHVLLADGTVVYLTDEITTQTVQEMLTIDGDEAIDPRIFDDF